MQGANSSAADGQIRGHPLHTLHLENEDSGRSRSGVRKPEVSRPMIYSFKCACGSARQIHGSISIGPPDSVPCPCGRAMRRDWRADIPQMDTSACRDHGYIPPDKRVMRPVAPRDPLREEHRFHQHIQERRKLLRDGNRGSMRHTHSIPADLYHGKIRETGDRKYWDDPKNVSRHSNCRVDTG